MQSVESRFPWEIVSCDIMGPFPRSPKGNRYLLVVTDHFSKWVELHPLRQLSSRTIWDKLRDTFTRFGFCSQLISDNASYFTSKVFEDCSTTLGIQHKCTTPYHPQANIAERVNRNLKAMLVVYTERHKDWDNYIPEMAFATRTTENRTTGFTPSQINFGRELRFPLENSFSDDNRGPNTSYARFAEQLRDKITDAGRVA